MTFWMARNTTFGMTKRQRLGQRSLCRSEEPCDEESYYFFNDLWFQQNGDKKV